MGKLATTLPLWTIKTRTPPGRRTMADETERMARVLYEALLLERKQVARLTRELAEARAEGWREALEAFRDRIDTERWHNFPVSMREFNNAIDATLAALVARGDGRGNG
jgi:hypothetical protein